MIGLGAAWVVLALAGEPEAPWRSPPSVEPQLLRGSSESCPPARVNRIVTTAPSATELLFALGLGDKIVGVSTHDDRPPEVERLPRVGGFLDPNVEAILGLRPDLVVAAPNGENRDRLDRLAELGRCVLVVPGNGFSDLWHATRALGRVLGGDVAQRGERLLGRVERSVEALQRASSRLPSPRVALVYGHAPLVLAGPGSFGATLLGLLNAENVVKVEKAYPSYSIEQLLVDRPQVILDSAMERGASLEFWSRYSALPAVRSGRVHAIEGTELLRIGPRVVEAMETLARLLYGPSVLQADQGVRSISKKSTSGESKARPLSQIR